MKRVTLAQVFSAATIAITLVVVTSFVLFVERSRSSALQTAQRKQDAAARRIEARVVRELSRAQRVLEQVESAIHSGVVSIDDSRSLEGDLFTRLVDDSHLEEVTFTHARLLGYDAQGEAQLAPDGRWQLSVARTTSGAVVTKSTRRDDDSSFTTQVRSRGKDASFASVPFVANGKAPDPTEHFTFSVLATKELHGHATWSDLSNISFPQCPLPALRPELGAFPTKVSHLQRSALTPYRGASEVARNRTAKDHRRHPGRHAVSEEVALLDHRRRSTLRPPAEVVIGRADQ